MKIIHISDLHFGTETPAIIDALSRKIETLNVDMVLVSGDFTQIANKKEFLAAQDFLKKLSCPVFCVPGNHDIPARNLWERFMSPYKKYKQYISPDLCPVFESNEILLAGLNSARRALPHWNWANGAISGKQRKRLEGIFDPDEKRWTICTFHHPVHKVDELPMDVTVFGRKRTLNVIQKLKIDLVLTGHVHHASMTLRGDDTHQTVYLSASTALSSRTRGQENGFNVITLGEMEMQVEMYKLQGGSFVAHKTYKQKKRG